MVCAMDHEAWRYIFMVESENLLAAMVSGDSQDEEMRVVGSRNCSLQVLANFLFIDGGTNHLLATVFLDDCLSVTKDPGCQVSL